MLASLSSLALALLLPSRPATQRARPIVLKALTQPTTISEAKMGFERAYGLPVPMSTQAFVNEMSSSTVVVFQSKDYQYSRIFALGFETLAGTFMFEIQDDAKREKAKDALATGLGFERKTLKKDADDLLAWVEGKTEEDVLALDDMKKLAEKSKYSYTLGAGLIALMTKVGATPEGTDGAITRWCSDMGFAGTLGRD